MAQGQATSSPLIDSDRIEGTPVYSRDGERIGTIRRAIIDKANGRIAYLVMTFVESFGVGDVTYVIPWSRISYDRNEGGYRTDITEANLRSATPVAQEDLDSPHREPGETFFSIPPGWRSV
jgi:sporulation protein YlmC with PRC-barrel domain